MIPFVEKPMPPNPPWHNAWIPSFGYFTPSHVLDLVHISWLPSFGYCMPSRVRFNAQLMASTLQLLHALDLEQCMHAICSRTY
jgi:hypothetical protein